MANGAKVLDCKAKLGPPMQVFITPFHGYKIKTDKNLHVFINKHECPVAAVKNTGKVGTLTLEKCDSAETLPSIQIKAGLCRKDECLLPSFYPCQILGVPAKMD